MKFFFSVFALSSLPFAAFCGPVGQFLFPNSLDVSEDSPPVTISDSDAEMSDKEIYKQPPTKKIYDQFLFEVKGGYFFFTESSMRKVYDQGGIDVQVSGSFPIYKMLQIYSSVEYLEKSGHSLNGDQKTSIWEIPISLGLKPVFSLGSSIGYYFTIGPRYVFAKVHNHSSFVSQRISANGIGGFVNTGFIFVFAKHFTLDLFGEYSYAKLHFHNTHVAAQGNRAQVGGVTVGSGIGYCF